MARRGHSPTDDRLSPAAEAGLALWDQTATFGESRELVWNHLLGLCATIESNRELAQVAIRKAIGGDKHPAISDLTAAITRVEEALRATIPGLADQLVQRLQPLHTVWRAKGPGLLAQAAKIVEPGILAAEGHVVGVLPVVAGCARPLLHYNHVHMEAVLSDIDPTLPEILRLTWSLLQLNVDLPKYSEMIHSARLSLIAGLTLIPITLAAGEQLELTRLDSATIQRAVESWCCHLGAPENATELIEDWWSIYLQSRPPWGVAVTAMDRML